jgi:hypothetical protein
LKSKLVKWLGNDSSHESQNLAQIKKTRTNKNVDSMQLKMESIKKAVNKSVEVKVVNMLQNANVDCLELVSIVRFKAPTYEAARENSFQLTLVTSVDIEQIFVHGNYRTETHLTNSASQRDIFPGNL